MLIAAIGTPRDVNNPLKLKSKPLSLFPISFAGTLYHIQLHHNLIKPNPVTIAPIALQIHIQLYWKQFYVVVLVLEQVYWIRCWWTFLSFSLIVLPFLGGIPRPSPVMPQLSQELSLSQDFQFTYPYKSGNFKLLWYRKKGYWKICNKRWNDARRFC